MFFFFFFFFFFVVFCFFFKTHFRKRLAMSYEFNRKSRNLSPLVEMEVNLPSAFSAVKVAEYLV